MGWSIVVHPSNPTSLVGLFRLGVVLNWECSDAEIPSNPELLHSNIDL